MTERKVEIHYYSVDALTGTILIEGKFEGELNPGDWIGTDWVDENRQKVDTVLNVKYVVTQTTGSSAGLRFKGQDHASYYKGVTIPPTPDEVIQCIDSLSRLAEA